MANKITVGCWVETRWGPAVVCHIGKDHVGYRYKAVRAVDAAILWVANSDPTSEVKYLRDADDTSRMVVGLGGPYGEGPISPENPAVW